MNPVGSCLICGKQDELAVWLDPNIIAMGYYPYHGVCSPCREAAQHRVQSDGADVTAISVACPRCGLTFSEFLDESPRR